MRYGQRTTAKVHSIPSTKPNLFHNRAQHLWKATSAEIVVHGVKCKWNNPVIPGLFCRKHGGFRPFNKEVRS